MIGGRIAVHFGLIDCGVLLGLIVAVTASSKARLFLLNTFGRPRKCDIIRHQQ